jgi:hypothetical protein
MGIWSLVLCCRSALSACLGSDRGGNEPGQPIATCRTGVAHRRSSDKTAVHDRTAASMLPKRVEVQAKSIADSQNGAMLRLKIMAEENFSYPRVLIGRQPNSHINCLFDGRTSKPAAEPLQRAVPPSRVGFSVRPPPARAEGHLVWRKPVGYCQRAVFARL